MSECINHEIDNEKRFYCRALTDIQNLEKQRVRDKKRLEQQLEDQKTVEELLKPHRERLER